MALLNRNEIRRRLSAFAKEWQHASREEANAKLPGAGSRQTGWRLENIHCYRVGEVPVKGRIAFEGWP
jgi:hypothetical protein